MQTSRFGEGLSVPLTADVEHELRLIIVAETLRTAGRNKLEDGSLTDPRPTEFVDTLVAEHGVAIDRAKGLVSPFGFGGTAPAAR